MEASDKSSKGGGVKPSMAWMQLYTAALTGLLSSDPVGSAASVAKDAADVADAAATLLSERIEILRLAQAVVDQPEPEE